VPHKKRNWELEFGNIHNIPEQFFYQFGKVTLHSENIFKTPSVTTNRVLQTDTVHKIFIWEHDNKIKKIKRMEWVDLINPITDLLKIPKKTRKELFSDYKETQIVKLKQYISAMEKAGKILYNDEIRLIHLVEPLINHKLVYQIVLKTITKRQTGEHQLLYDLLMPVVDRLEEHGLSDYRIRKVIDNLMLVFEYDGESVGQSVLKYKKKPYFPKKIMDMIDDAGNQPFQPFHQALKRHLDSI
tara:strand:- start:300 stop:1025 length:726 start_codon:yes stop_codon:yes gene_type:complete